MQHTVTRFQGVKHPSFESGTTWLISQHISVFLRQAALHVLDLMLERQVLPDAVFAGRHMSQRVRVFVEGIPQGFGKRSFAVVEVEEPCWNDENGMRMYEMILLIVILSDHVLTNQPVWIQL